MTRVILNNEMLKNAYSTLLRAIEGDIDIPGVYVMQVYGRFLRIITESGETFKQLDIFIHDAVPLAAQILMTYFDAEDECNMAEVRLNKEMLKQAYDMLLKAIKEGLNIDGIYVRQMCEKILKIETDVGKELYIPICYAPLLAANILMVYFVAESECAEMTRRFKMGVWD